MAQMIHMSSHDHGLLCLPGSLQSSQNIVAGSLFLENLDPGTHLKIRNFKTHGKGSRVEFILEILESFPSCPDPLPGKIIGSIDIVMGEVDR